MKKFLQVAAFAICAVSLPASAACYTVLGAKNKVIYQSTSAPIDMSRQIHETLPGPFPGANMVFSLRDTTCPEIRPLSLTAGDVPEGITRSARSAAKPAGGAPINLDNFFNSPSASRGYGGY